MTVPGGGGARPGRPGQGDPVPGTAAGGTGDAGGAGSLARRIALAGFALAILVRVLFLADKPFWRDEVWVAELTQSGLPEILSTASPSPVGFLVLSKFVARVAELVPGVPPEVSLRLVPLICGLAAVALLPRLAGALGATPIVKTTVLLLAAGAPPLVYYSRELKHYGLDLLFAALVPLLVIRFFGRDGAAGASRHDGRGIALLGSLLAAPWLSFASLFPIAGALSWGWLRPWRGATPAVRRRWALLTLAYAASFALAFGASVQRQAASPRLHQFWEESVGGGADLPAALRAVSVAIDCVRVPFSYFFPGLELIALPLAALGLAGWVRPGAAVLRHLLLATLALTAAAVLADRYLATKGRFLLFLAPLLLLCVACGLEQLGRLLGPLLGARGAARGPLAIGALAALAWAGTAIAHRLPPQNNDLARYFRYDIIHEVEPLIAAAARTAGPADPVLVSSNNVPAFRWYGRGRLPNAAFPPSTKAVSVRNILRGWAGKERAWVLLIDEEQRNYDRMTAQEGFTWSLAARSRGGQLWEIRPGAARRRFTPPAEPGKAQAKAAKDVSRSRESRIP